MGQTIQVRFNENLLAEDECLGRSHLINNIIELQQPNDQVNETVVYATFWHEFFHFAAFLTGYEKLNQNEQFIDLMANCLVQLMQSAAVYDPDFLPTDDEIEIEWLFDGEVDLDVET